MARPKKAVYSEVLEQKAQDAQEVQKEIMADNLQMSPLPNAVVNTVEQIEQVEQVEQPQQNKVYYAFCRISGGLLVNIKNEYGEISHKILKSGNNSRLAADGTRVFELRPAEFGVTELSAEEYKQIKEALEPMKCYKKGFVFFTDDLAKGEKMAREQVAKYPTQGTEQLGAEQAKEVATFSE